MRRHQLAAGFFLGLGLFGIDRVWAGTSTGCVPPESESGGLPVASVSGTAFPGAPGGGVAASSGLDWRPVLAASPPWFGASGVGFEVWTPPVMTASTTLLI